MSDVAEYWNEQAASFDDQPDHGLREPGVRAAWAALLKPLLPDAPARIADLGCGTGSLALLIASLGHQLEALDIAPAMVERARAKSAAAGLPVNVVVGDANRTPWSDDSFDVVISRHLLWALEDPTVALREWFRVLRPAGRLLLIEGRWSTGAGLSAASIVELLTRSGHSAIVTPLPDPRLWGKAIADERYVVVSDGPHPSI